MTRRRFHILVAIILLVCVACPYIESALDWDETLFTTGYDTESVVAIIALLLILSLTLAKLMAVFLPARMTTEPIVISPSPRKRDHSFVFDIPEVSSPLPLRI
jgi:hypothetical protein